MNKLPLIDINIKHEVDVELENDYTQPSGSDGSFPKKPKFFISRNMIDHLNLIIDNQNDIIDNLQKVLKSRIGATILGLEKGIENDEKAQHETKE